MNSTPNSELTQLTEAELREQLYNARVLQWNASQMRRAKGVFKMEREIKAICRELNRRGLR